MVGQDFIEGCKDAADDLGDLLRFRGSVSAGEFEIESASGQHGHSDQGFGRVVAVSAFGQGPDMGVRRLGSGIRQAVLESVEDQPLKFDDGAGQRDEFGEAAARGPGDPPHEEPSTFLTLGGEDRAELLFEQVSELLGGTNS